jgi:hypothetical protein
MVLEKGQPGFARIATAPNSSQVSSHAPFENDEAGLLKFSVDLGGSPVQVLFRQASDQNPNLIGELRPATAWPGSPTPVETETGAAPADDGLGIHDDEDAGPAGPEVVEGGPEEPVQGVPCWPRPFAFKRGDRLARRERTKSGTNPPS